VVEVASADAIQSRARRLLRVEHSSMYARVAKVLLLPFVFLTEGLSGGASDVARRGHGGPPVTWDGDPGPDRSADERRRAR